MEKVPLLKKKVLKIPLTRDMKYGGIRFPNEGHQVRDKISGDAIIVVRPPKGDDPSGFKLMRGNDIFLLKEVPLIDTLCGIKFMIKHLNDEDIAFKVPENVIVATGDIYRINGLGMPANEEATEFGDLLIQFSVNFPSELSQEQKEHLYQALGKPTQIPDDVVPRVLNIEKTAHDIQQEEDEEEEVEEGGGGQTCVQQ